MRFFPILGLIFWHFCIKKTYYEFPNADNAGFAMFGFIIQEAIFAAAFLIYIAAIFIILA